MIIIKAWIHLLEKATNEFYGEVFWQYQNSLESSSLWVFMAPFLPTNVRTRILLSHSLIEILILSYYIERVDQMVTSWKTNKLIKIQK